MVNNLLLAIDIAETALRASPCISIAAEAHALTARHPEANANIQHVAEALCDQIAELRGCG